MRSLGAVRRPRDLVVAAVAVAVTALAAWAARGTALDGIDRAMFTALNSLPAQLYRPLWLLQLVGVLGMPVLVAVAAAGVRRFRLAVGLLLLVPAKLVVEYDILKALVTRPRPGASVPGAVLREVPVAGAAFPSGHAVILFGMVTLLSPYLSRRARILTVAVAVVAALARVYLGAHTPLDVIGGATTGVAVGALLTLLVGVSRERAAGGPSSSRPEPKSPGPRADPPGTVRINRVEDEGDDGRNHT